MAHTLSRRDLDFLLYEWLDITSLTEREKFSAHSRETFDGILDLSADLAEKLFAPHNKAGDQNPPYVGDDGKVVLIDDVKTATDAYADADLIAAEEVIRFHGVLISPASNSTEDSARSACRQDRSRCPRSRRCTARHSRT